MNNTTKNKNNNKDTSIKVSSAINNPINLQYSNTIHKNTDNIPQHERINEGGNIGSKNNHFNEAQKPCHNFGHDVNIPHQKSYGTNLKTTIYHDDTDDSGWLNDRKNRPMSATYATYDTKLDKERGTERDYSPREDNSVHKQHSQLPPPPRYREPPPPINDRLHHQYSEHKPQQQHQDAKWWRRETEQKQSAPFEDIRSVPAHGAYDRSGRCSNNVYDVHDQEQTRGTCRSQKEQDLTENKVTS